MTLRWKWGFCDAPLSVESPDYEYAFAPSQDRHRFGRHILYNSFSQRSQEPDSSKTIVLGLGDSVINGGVLTDHSALATTLASDSAVQILNISAGSWGPDNCAAYLKEFGCFGAEKMLLVVSSHDAHDVMDFQKVVGTRACPSKQYKLAILELLDRYLLPRFIPGYGKENDPDKKVANGVGIDKGSDGPFNPGFNQLKEIAASCGIPMYIYLHADTSEIEDGKFNSQGEEIIAWAEQNNIPLTSGFDAGEKISLYRDGIHLSEEGQKILADWMRVCINQTE